MTQVPMRERLYRVMVRMGRRSRTLPMDDLLEGFRDRWSLELGRGGSFWQLRFWRLVLVDLLRTSWDPSGLHPRHAGQRRWTSGTFSHDFRMALRTLRRNPAYSIMVVVTLAIALGANTAVFSLVYGVMLRPLPLGNANRIVTLSEVNETFEIEPRWISLPNLEDVRTMASSFEYLTPFRGRSMSITGGERPVYVYGAFVGGDFFQALGVPPMLGRSISLSDVRAEAAVVVLGHRIWRTEMGADSSMVGRSISVDGVTREVVGVMPPGFDSPGPWIGPGTSVGLWIPFTITDNSRLNRSFHALGLLTDGVSLSTARNELTIIDRQLAEAYPGPNSTWRLRAAPWAEMVVGDVGATLWLVWASVGLIILIACANVVNLTLNRLLSRQSEFALRLALGATRWRLTRQLFVEALTLASVGGVLGLAMGWGVMGLVRLVNPGNIPRLQGVAINEVAVGVTLLAILLTAVLCTVGPAFQMARRHASGNFAQSDTRVVGGHTMARNAIAVMELALTFLLVVSSGLVARSFHRLMQVSPGIEAEGVAQVSVALSWSRVETIEERVQFVTAVLDRLRALPGVTNAAMINALPFSGSNGWWAYWRMGEKLGPASNQPVVAVRSVSSEYFDVMRIPFLTGRDFTDADVGSRSAIIVNRTFADQLVPGGSPLGTRIAVRDGMDTLTVIGVVGDVRHFGLDADVQPELYEPMDQDGNTSKSFVVRTAGNPLEMIPTLRNTIEEIDPDQPVRDASPMADVVAGTFAAQRFNAVIFNLASAIALALAGVGLYGVLSYSVSSKRGEIGVRMVLGARRGRVVSDVVGQGVKLAVLGLLIGGAAALATTRWMSSLLFEIEPGDGVSYLIAVLTLLTLVVVACGRPAWRASTMDPATALRSSDS